jgi:hypothetical protein
VSLVRLSAGRPDSRLLVLRLVCLEHSAIRPMRMDQPHDGIPGLAVIDRI